MSKLCVGILSDVVSVLLLVLLSVPYTSGFSGLAHVMFRNKAQEFFSKCESTLIHTHTHHAQHIALRFVTLRSVTLHESA